MSYGSVRLDTSFLHWSSMANSTSFRRIQWRTTLTSFWRILTTQRPIFTTQHRISRHYVQYHGQGWCYGGVGGCDTPYGLKIMNLNAYFQDHSFVFYILAKLIGGWGYTFHPKIKMYDVNMYSYYAEGHFLTVLRDILEFFSEKFLPRPLSVSQRSWYLGTWRVLLYR